MEGHWVVRIGRMIHQGDAAGGVGRGRAAVIDPSGGLPENLLLVSQPVRVENPPAAVTNTDGLGHTHADQAEWTGVEGRLTVFRSVEADVDEHQPFVAVERFDRDAALLDHQRLAVGVLPRVQGKQGRLLTTVLVSRDSLADDPSATIFPEVDPVDVLMGDPHGIVMTVADGVLRVPHARVAAPGRADQWEQKRPVERRAEVVSRQLTAAMLKRRLVIGQGSHRDIGNRPRFGQPLVTEQKGRCHGNRHGCDKGYSRDHPSSSLQMAKTIGGILVLG